MSIVFLLAPLSLLLGGLFVLFFFRSVERGQFEDLETPARRMLFEENKVFDSKDVTSLEMKGK